MHDATAELAEHVRATGRPALLHLRTVRYMGHAGTDVEAGYRNASGIRRDYGLDPILGTARAIVGAGLHTPDELVDEYLTTREHVRKLADDLAGGAEARDRRAGDGAAVAAPSRAWCRRVPRCRPRRNGAPRCSRTALPEHEGGLTLAESINRALADALCSHPGALVFGEDVGVKGGVYGVTRGLQKKFGAARVFDSLLDEQSILGLALGAAVSGLLPIPEIQYLAYLHNAEDQIRGEAASLSFFSNGQYRNPMVVRDRRARLPEGLRRALPQRQRGRRAARHPRARGRLARAPVRCRADAAHARGRGRGRRHGERVPRADRALPHPRPVRTRRRRVDRAVPAARGVGRPPRPDRVGPRWSATATTC